jgi:hypothetical protein
MNSDGKGLLALKQELKALALRESEAGTDEKRTLAVKKRDLISKIGRLERADQEARVKSIKGLS